MGSWARVSILTIPWCTINAESAMDSKLGTVFYKMYRSTNNRKLSLPPFAWDNYRLRSIGVIKSSQDVSYFQTEQQVGTWEEPDTGSDSESDGEEVEDHFVFASDGMKTSVAADVNITSGDNYEELIKKGSFFSYCFISFGIITWFCKLDQSTSRLAISSIINSPSI